MQKLTVLLHTTSFCLYHILMYNVFYWTEHFISPTPINDSPKFQKTGQETICQQK